MGKQADIDEISLWLTLLFECLPWGWDKWIFILVTCKPHLTSAWTRGQSCRGQLSDKMWWVRNAMGNAPGLTVISPKIVRRVSWSGFVHYHNKKRVSPCNYDPLMSDPEKKISTQYYKVVKRPWYLYWVPRFLSGLCISGYILLREHHIVIIMYKTRPRHRVYKFWWNDLRALLVAVHRSASGNESEMVMIID